jgi:hypothetical protein
VLNAVRNGVKLHFALVGCYLNCFLPPASGAPRFGYPRPEALPAPGLSAPLVRPGRILQRLQPVQYQESALAPDITSQPFALVPGRARGWVRVSEPAQRLIDEQIGGSGAVAGPLTVERPRVDPLGSPIVVGRQSSFEQVTDQRCLADSAKRIERDKGSVTCYEKPNLELLGNSVQGYLKTQSAQLLD